MTVTEPTTQLRAVAVTYSDTLVTVQVHTPDEGDAYKNLYVYAGSDPINNVDPWGLCAEATGNSDLAMAGMLGLFTWSGSSQMNYLWNQIQNTTSYMRNFPVGSEAWRALSAETQNLYARLAATAGASYTAAGSITGYGALGLTGAGSTLSLGAIGGLAAGTAVVGAGVGYGISQIPVGGGENVGSALGNVLYNVAPSFWNSVGQP